MPVWYDRTRDLEDEGLIETVGLIQEQHPDRTKLFLQWKKMDFPIMIDPLNRLGVRVVPITVLIDEAGVVRAVRPEFEEVERFARSEPASTLADYPSSVDAPDLEALAEAASEGSIDEQRRYADALVLRGERRGALDRAIDLYEQIVELHPDDAVTHFRLGVAQRMRFDRSEEPKAADFRRAIEHWSRALALNPNQYIWRRRIQQYGPRLDKPYSFYDWVNMARKEISERGEEPHPLSVEPTGAEFAYPQRDEEGAATIEPINPDPQGEIQPDEKNLIEIEVVEVPSTQPDQADTKRIHLVFSPNEELNGHWNNEVEGLVVWLDPAAGVEVSERRLEHPNPTDRAVSDEDRTVEFEVRLENETAVRIPGYALYYVCEGAEGTCLYLRHEIEVTID